MHPLHDECVRLRTVEKKTGKEIAQILGLSQSCVSNWLKPYPLSREDRVEDKALYAECIRLRVNEKKTLTEIAEIIGASKAAISNWLKDYPLTEEERQIGLTRLQAASGPISPTDMLICGECGKTKLSREFNVTRRNVASSKRKRCCKTCSAIKKDAKNSRPPRNVETEKTCNNCGRTDAKELFAQGRNLCLVCFRKDKNERQAYHRAREIDIPEQAKCNSCGKVKPATKFDRNRSTPTGLMPIVRSAGNVSNGLRSSPQRTIEFAN
jgi:predicted transcriptional regulator